MRYVVKLAYIGSSYHGYQIQRGVSTVEGEFRRALNELGILESNPDFRSGARTDAGVHALAQVIAFNAIKEPSLAAINSKLDQIWAWGIAQACPGFDPRRRALWREYLYLIPDSGLDLDRMLQVLHLFQGTHDFGAFSTGTTQIRTVCGLDLVPSKGFLMLKIRARAFAQRMVRKIASALILVGRGEKDESWLRKLLSGWYERIPAAPPEGLILMNVELPLKFRLDLNALQLALKQLDRNLIQISTLGRIYELLRSEFSEMISSTKLPLQI